jgi:hypothetical protein
MNTDHSVKIWEGGRLTGTAKVVKARIQRIGWQYAFVGDHVRDLPKDGGSAPFSPCPTSGAKEFPDAPSKASPDSSSPMVDDFGANLLEPITLE